MEKGSLIFIVIKLINIHKAKHNRNHSPWREYITYRFLFICINLKLWFSRSDWILFQSFFKTRASLPQRFISNIQYSRAICMRSHVTHTDRPLILYILHNLPEPRHTVRVEHHWCYVGPNLPSKNLILLRNRKVALLFIIICEWSKYFCLSRKATVL